MVATRPRSILIVKSSHDWCVCFWYLFLFGDEDSSKNNKGKLHVQFSSKTFGRNWQLKALFWTTALASVILCRGQTEK